MGGARAVLEGYLSLGVLALLVGTPARADLPFDHVVIDAANPSDPHCKALGDIDGDGLIDALVASSSGGGMYWYEYPDWIKHAVRVSGSWTTDMQVGDVDGDGDLDVVIPNSAGIQWYENPRPGGNPRTDTWVEHLIGSGGANHHDVRLGDIEPDGDLDVVTRKKGGSPAYLWRQGPADVWTRVTVQDTVSGEGTALGDLDGDGDLDVAQSGFWVEQVSPTSWAVHTIDGSFADDTGVEIVDIDGNGDLDVVLGPSESSSGKLSWYTALDPKTGPWVEYPIDPSVSYLHTFKAADIDNDGDLDLVTAEMHQSSNPDEVGIYFNVGDGTAWKQQVVAESGSHNLRVGDIGGDGDIDIFGANWNDSAPNSAVVEYWENTMAPLALDQWTRHIVETDLPWRSPFVLGGDLNGDSLPDLVAGGWWYPNPGVLGGTWTRQTIGAPMNNAALLRDLDRDGDLDILGTDGAHSGEAFSWARNNGAAVFTNFPINNTAMGGDFLQGVGIGQVEALGQDEVVLSWHNGGTGTAMLEIPADPTTLLWPQSVLSASTNQEAVPIGDLDGDGDTDIHQGTFWLRQDPGGSFSVQSGITLSGGGVPDRVVLADMDGDEDLDVVIGVEFGSALVWGENDGSGAGWAEHAIAADFDYFSVDARDLDGDGDIDVVGGAHQGNGKVSIYENDGTGLVWTTHVVDSGDSSALDHHDGTQFVDMDLDGDLDIISVGWTKKSLVIYENLALDGGGPEPDTEKPTLVSAHAATAQEVVVDFSEEVLAAGAENVANYSISDGVVIGGVVLEDNQRSVTLTTSALGSGAAYTLTVDDVADLAGNSIAAGTTAVFELGSGVPDIGLVAYWPFDLGAGGVAPDASGNGHTGFLVNGAKWVAGPVVDLDGVDDYVDAGRFDVSGSALTLAVWVWADTFDNCSSRDCRILSKATGTAEGDHFFMLSTISSGASTRLRFRLKTSGSTKTLIASSGDLPVQTWMHAAAVYNGSKMELFLDGVSVGSTSKSGSLTGDASVPVWIGGNPTDSAAKPWNGKVDEARIYNRALSATELALLPPASLGILHSDGFESHDLSAWASHSGSLDVLATATRVGTRGLRAQAGSACAVDDEVIVEPPPTTTSGLHQACRHLIVQGVEVVAPGATLEAGETITLSEGVSVSADTTMGIDPSLAPVAWVTDRSPNSESAYVAEFDVDLDGLTLGATDRFQHLVARAAGSEWAFAIVVQGDGVGGKEVVLEARLSDGSVVSTPATEEVAIPPGWHRWRVTWSTGAGDGQLSFSLDGVASGALTGLSNDVRRIDSIDWGVVDGDLDASSGSIDLDAFNSWAPPG